MKVILLCLVIFLVGCAHQLQLISRDNSGNGSGNAQEAGKQITITIGSTTFKGTYVYDGGSAVSSYSYSNATAYSRHGSVNAYGSNVGFAYMPGSGNGRVVATSGSNTIHCDFMYKGGSGIGYCQDNNGKEYDLIIH